MTTTFPPRSATDRQIKKIGVLRKQCGLEFEIPGGYVPTMTEASKMILCLEGQIEVEGVVTAPKRKVERVKLDDGYYLFNDTCYKVLHAVHGSGHQYAKKMVIVLTGEKDENGKPLKKGSWVREFGILGKLRPEHVLSRENSKHFGEIYGCCSRCGRTLTDEKSIAYGMGPWCRGEQGW